MSDGDRQRRNGFGSRSAYLGEILSNHQRTFGGITYVFSGNFYVIRGLGFARIAEKVNFVLISFKCIIFKWT